MYDNIIAGYSTIVLKIDQWDVLQAPQILDLTPLARFKVLRNLWIAGFTNQKIAVTVNNSRVTSLPIEHLHLDLNLASDSLEEQSEFSSFTETMTQLKTFDAQNTMSKFSGFNISQWMSFVGEKQSLEAVSFRYMQSNFRVSSITRTLNIGKTFPSQATKKVRYLDLSHNSYETVAGGFVKTFPVLKYLDLSHNNLIYYYGAITSLYPMVLFHPSIQVIVVDQQFKNNNKAHSNNGIYHAERLRRSSFLSGIKFECFLASQTTINDMFSNQEKLCSFLNCNYYHDIDEEIPCEDIPPISTDTGCFESLVIPVAPQLRQLSARAFTPLSDPREFMADTVTFCLDSSSLQSLDLSENDIMLTSFRHDLPRIRGLDTMQEFRLTNMGLHNGRVINVTELDAFPGLKRLYLSSNSLFIPVDFKLCHMFPYITVLEISNCKLQQLPQYFLDDCKYLEQLNISDNHMTSIPKHLRKALDDIQHFQNLSVDFSRNPFHCHCGSDYSDVISMIHWMRDTNVNLLDHRNYQCIGHEDAELLLEKDTDLYKDICSNTEEVIQAVSSTLGVCLAVALLTVCSYVAHKHRYRLKTWYYRHKLSRARGKTRITSEFDIYIGYDDNDKSFVIYELTQILENVYGFRCCIPDRDFHGEGVHTELISHFMNKCRMSIIVLSRKAVQNPIHFMERNLARQIELHSFQMQKVIYILIDDLSDVTDFGIQAIVSANVGLRYTDESVAHNEAFYGRLSSKIYRTLFQRLQQQASGRNDKLRGGCM